MFVLCDEVEWVSRVSRRRAQTRRPPKWFARDQPSPQPLPQAANLLLQCSGPCHIDECGSGKSEEQMEHRGEADPMI